MNAYQKEDGKWYVLQKIDNTASFERLAGDDEIEAAQATEEKPAKKKADK